MKRGDLVTIALPGTYEKPRPALVIQSDLFDEHPSVTILPVTSELRNTPLFRVTVEPDATNGLRQPSQVMVDKAQSVPREKVGETFGRSSWTQKRRFAPVWWNRYVTSRTTGRWSPRQKGAC